MDPAYTVPLIVAFVGAFIFKSDRAMRVTTVALVLSTGYLVGAALPNSRLMPRCGSIAERGIATEVYESTPAPLNTLLWRGVAVQGDQYYEIWASVFDEVQTFRSIPTRATKPYWIRCEITPASSVFVGLPRGNIKPGNPKIRSIFQI